MPLRHHHTRRQQRNVNIFPALVIVPSQPVGCRKMKIFFNSQPQKKFFTFVSWKFFSVVRTARQPCNITLSSGNFIFLSCDDKFLKRYQDVHILLHFLLLLHLMMKAKLMHFFSGKDFFFRQGKWNKFQQRFNLFSYARWKTIFFFVLM